MRSRLPFFTCLAAAAMLLAACSSTTVVARDDRTTDSATSAAGAQTEDPPTQTTASDASEIPESAVDTDDNDDDRGGRELEAPEGFGLGGAEQIESLFADCNDGNDLACDVLLQLSAFDSPEELAAETCGGRSDAIVTFCTDGIDADDDGIVFDPASPSLDRVVEACEVDGNMTACDFLFYRSSIDSDFQEIGGTCGGRVNVAVPDCRTIFAE